MTRIIYRDTKPYQELVLSGHAETAEEGRVNVVCAAVSAISQTLYANLQREAEKGQIQADGDMPQPGEMWMRAWTRDENRAAVRHMFEFTITGLKEVEKAYPEQIRVEEEKLNGDF